MVQTSHHDEFGVESVEQFVEHAPIRIQRLVPDGTVLQANQALLGSRLLDLGYTVVVRVRRTDAPLYEYACHEGITACPTRRPGNVPQRRLRSRDHPRPKGFRSRDCEPAPASQALLRRMNFPA